MMLPVQNPAHVVVLMLEDDGRVVAASRRNKPGDLNLVGGKRNPGEDPKKAAIREAEEETGVVIQPEDLEWVFERVDETDGGVAWCYLARKWEGEPRTCEPGVEISKQWPSRLVEEGCTFREYNLRLFAQLKML